MILPGRFSVAAIQPPFDTTLWEFIDAGKPLSADVLAKENDNSTYTTTVSIDIEVLDSALEKARVNRSSISTLDVVASVNTNIPGVTEHKWSVNLSELVPTLLQQYISSSSVGPTASASSLQATFYRDWRKKSSTAFGILCPVWLTISSTSYPSTWDFSVSVSLKIGNYQNLVETRALPPPPELSSSDSDAWSDLDEDE